MLKRLLFVLLIGVAGLEGATLKERINFIQSAIEKTIQSADPTAQVGIEVIALNKRTLLYKRNEEKRYVPGSSLKLFTAATALDILGVDYRFETKILIDGMIIDGDLAGNCYLVASGDPSLGLKGMEELAHQIKRAGIKRIKGNLVIDLGVFDAVEMGPGWMWDEEAAYWCSPLSALNVEHNCVSFWVKPNQEAGRPCFISFTPKCDGIYVINRSMTRKQGGSIEVKRLTDGRFEVVGDMSVEDKPRLFKIPVRIPHLYAADILKHFFTANQMTFEGEVKIGNCPKEAKIVGVHQSEALAEILKTVLKNSDNLCADALFKKVGQARFGTPGTWQKGGQTVREFLSKKVGMDVSEMVILDGSGESRYNLISPNQMVKFLTWVHEKFPYAAELKAALPIAGVDGTLKKRMTAPFLHSKVRAKTGSMTGISSLCGYIKGEEDVMAFAIFVNGYVKSGREIKRKLEDGICHALVNAGL